MNSELSAALVAWDDKLLMEGRGLSGFVTIAVDALKRGVSLDPRPLNLHRNENTKAYRNQITKQVRRLQNQRVDAADFEQTVRRSMTRHMIKSYVNGASSINNRFRFGPADTAFIAQRVESQLSFMRGFMRSVVGDTGTMPLERRAGMYANFMDSVFIEGAVSQAPNGIIIYWRLNPAEHCVTCLDLAEGSPYTKETLPTVPRRGDTRCITACKCTLEFTTRLKAGFRRIVGLTPFG